MSTSNKKPAASKKAMVDRFDLRHAPGHLLRRCHSRARAIFDEMIGRDTGLSKQQVALMVAVSHMPAATHNQLADETGFDRNTLADTLDRLIAKGLMVRVRSPADGRAYEVRMTDAGRTMLESLIHLSFQVQAKILEPVPEALREDFIRCLRLVAGVDEADAPEPPQPRA